MRQALLLVARPVGDRPLDKILPVGRGQGECDEIERPDVARPLKDEGFNVIRHERA
jgi:hypothetical protein